MAALAAPTISASGSNIKWSVCGLRPTRTGPVTGHAGTAFLALSLTIARILSPLAHEPFLRHRGNERAVAGEDETAREAARAREIGAVLGIEKPVVGAKRPVQPECVIETGGHDGLFEYRTALRDQCRVEER